MTLQYSKIYYYVHHSKKEMQMNEHVSEMRCFPPSRHLRFIKLFLY